MILRSAAQRTRAAASRASGYSPHTISRHSHRDHPGRPTLTTSLGFAIGFGHRQGQGTRAFILEPQDPCCPADLDGNNDVGISDLLILLADWGPCPDCGDCGVDLDGDGSVGVSDLLILQAAWGPCDGSGGGTALQQAVQAMGFRGVRAYQAWLARASDPECFASGCVLYTILRDQE